MHAHGKLTLQGVETRKAVPPRLFANDRYVTTGLPKSGGLASVYRAREIESGAQVALKVFRPLSGTDDVVEESFKREAQALSGLKHENIVRILDAGYEVSTGEHFIAMEWVPQDLEVVRKTKKFRDWAHFYCEVGHYVLQALAFAHANAIVHRDVKPSNILITDDGVVKVCDFGISKIRNFLEPGVTLAHFATIPYAPPEPDDGNYSYSRDVFGFAATCVTVLADEHITSHRELMTALEQLVLDDPVRRLLRRSLSLDNPAERQVNAVVLLAELDRLRPKQVKVKDGTVLVALTKKVKDIVSYDIGLNGDQAIEKYVLADLQNAACQYDTSMKPLGVAAVVTERSIRLYGERYGYIAVRDGTQGQTLKLVSASDLPPVELDRYRGSSLESPFSFSTAGELPLNSAFNITSLRSQLDDFSSEQKLGLIKQSQQQIYRTWLDLLSAKTELEKNRKRMFRYVEINAAGNLVEFKLAAGSDFGFLEDKEIRIEHVSDGAYLGTVINVEQDVLTVQASDRNRVDASGLPVSGIIGVDTAKADAALDKQKTAVDAVRYGRSIDPMLGDYIVDPSSVPVSVVSDRDFIQSKIDDDKKDAVRSAMSAPPLMIVEGPPGTGKTTFITELVLQTLRDQPNARVLLTSQTHVALDNSLERITKESGGVVRAVRIGHEGDDRISDTTKPLLVDRKLPVMRKQAIAEGKKFIELWASQRGVDLSSTRMAMALGRHAGLRERLEDVATSIEGLRPLLQDGEREKLEAEEREDLDDKLGALVKEQDALSRDLKESMGEVRKYETDNETIQHLTDCSADDLRAWADSYAPQTPEGIQLRKMLAAHADWETRFGRSREFKAAVIASSQIVAGTCLGVMGVPGRNDISYDLCIVDEASIATPTEVLVPMSRARRTVLVGDNRQLSPFQDPELRSQGLLKKYQIDEKDQVTTLFRHLTDMLPGELRKTLSTQHRMLPAIGNLISECFYDGSLQSIDRAPDPGLASALPKPVVWRSTSRMPNRASKQIGTSYVNDLEVELIVRLLTKLDFDLRHGKHKGEQRSVAVLTGYGEQKRRLHSAIDTRQHGWISFSKIYVNVVDAFQGREADAVIFSVTRSEAKGLGFLREMERINVALSRGKELLIIVGDHSYCQQANDTDNPLKDVIDYIRRNPNDCVIEEVAP